MCKIYFNDKLAITNSEETILDALLRNSIEVPFSCRNGTCQTCIMKLEEGEVRQKFANTLSANFIEKGFFLPCAVTPETDLHISIPEKTHISFQAKIVEKEIIEPDVCRLVLEVENFPRYQAGQYIPIINPATGETRPYSLASVHELDPFLEIHIKHIPGGQFSTWIFSELWERQEIHILPPSGKLVYSPDYKKENLLLIATGTGLSPLIGVIREALKVYQHEGNIFLYHGGRRTENLYLHDLLLDMEKQYDQLFYFPCISGDVVPEGYLSGRSTSMAIWNHALEENYQIYICGSDNVVTDTAQAIRQYGVKEENIHIESYNPNGEETSLSSPIAPLQEKESYEFKGEILEKFSPDQELWGALKNGKLLNQILEDFYGKVYRDHRLAVFFEHTTIDRAIQKQYSFLQDIFTGSKSFVGELPRNAHHWMVITDDLFDYRENLFAESLRNFGLSESLIQKWMDLHEQFRSRIVKNHPWEKIVDGVILPSNRFEEAIAEFEMLCDTCMREIKEGENIRYHKRLGTVFCENCTDQVGH
ncbi:MAG: 2Fe-2S iron-sulfur cluster binding domain-containing protein [Bacteroidetes bacterium]|nr:2Fe-2S iron-sulfur cluster binding domain-containing protein [Bacteroidota bacterium]